MKRFSFRLCFVMSVILILVSVFRFAWPLIDRKAFEDHYTSVAQKLNNAENRVEIRKWFSRNYNFTELFEWVHQNLKFVPPEEAFERNTDPISIFESRRGRCEEFSILYVAASLANGYQSRIVVAVDEGNPRALNGLHVWAEVKLDAWVHVDPSDRVWNQPYRYKVWFWGKDIGTSVRMYAFEDGICEDVTSNYNGS